jgi:hypothetical protein
MITANPGSSGETRTSGGRAKNTLIIAENNPDRAGAYTVPDFGARLQSLDRKTCSLHAALAGSWQLGR